MDQLGLSTFWLKIWLLERFFDILMEFWWILVPLEVVLEPLGSHFGPSWDAFLCFLDRWKRPFRPWWHDDETTHRRIDRRTISTIDSIRRPSGWRARLFFRLLSSFLDSPSLFWLLNPSYNPPQRLPAFRRAFASCLPGAIFFHIFYLDVFWPAFGMPFALILGAFWLPKLAKLM